MLADGDMQAICANQLHQSNLRAIPGGQEHADAADATDARLRNAKEHL
jgi:hypothetical protein